MLCSIEDILADFPETRIAFLVARNLMVRDERPGELQRAIEEAEEQARERFASMELAAIAEIQDWRRAYKAFGVKKTSYRSSVERLLKNVLADRSLPQINCLVDAYNLVSLAHLVPIGADDLQKVEGGVAFRYSKNGDTFYALAGDGKENDPPKPGEVVYSDEEKILCRRWNWQQDRRSPVTLGSTSAVLTVQAQAAADIEKAAAALIEALEKNCGAEVLAKIASRENPIVDLGT